MHSISKKTPFIIIGITSAIFSRTMFFFFDDPEGPNLLVVFVMAAVLYLPSLITYRLNCGVSTAKRVLLAICTQAVLATGIYFLL